MTANYRVGPLGFMSLEDNILPGKVGFPFSAKSQTYHRNHRKEKNLSIIFILLLELDQNSLKQSLYRCGKTSVCKVFKLLIPSRNFRPPQYIEAGPQ